MGMMEKLPDMLVRKLPEVMPNLSNAEVKLQAVHGEPGFWITLDVCDYITPAGDVVVVPKGFVTDLASIPRPLWAILPPFGRYTAAALLHDYLYFKQDRERWEADQVFLDAMIELNVRRWKRASMHRAVRMFGNRPWNNKVTSKQQSLNA